MKRTTYTRNVLTLSKGVLILTAWIRDCVFQRFFYHTHAQEIKHTRENFINN